MARMIWLPFALVVVACAPATVTEQTTEPFHPGETPALAWVTLRNGATLLAHSPRVEHDSLVWVERVDGGDVEPDTPLTRIARHAIAMSDIREIQVPSGGGDPDHRQATAAGVIAIATLVAIAGVVLTAALYGGHQ
ncbi:MAG TPA: hypothetical protein VEV39_14730 [Gemmatimonadales bacterium]|nr:hypothetical protein [Gemmatimonadales bacterium]